MNVLHPVCCGLDVHKKTVTACLLKTGASGETVKVLRVFRTLTSCLRQLADWLRQEGCRHVAMESTGVYWKPVHNLLEGVCQEVLLVNAQHIKNVPGRKTDQKDAEWIATLLQAGLLRGSFVPPKEIRELRDLTRYRTQVVRQRADECNRIQKLLENCNIKLAAVATDVLGKSGHAMLTALCAGQDDPEQLADLARGRLRAKIPDLIEALRGVMTDSQRWLLSEQLRRIAELDEAIGRLDDRIGEQTRPFEPVLERLDRIPGVNRRIAEILVAEIGVDMKAFPTAGQLASWAGMCPGNHESAGKRRGGKPRKGNRWLHAALVEAGWAAARTKGGSLSATYHRVASRRGGRRACVAVGHRILRMVHALLSRGGAYQETGPDYYRAASKEQLKDKLLGRLRRLGYTVTVTVEETAA
jgi:transposase